MRLGGFWLRVKKGTSDECWLWTGRLDSLGYGQTPTHDGTRRAHRVMWIITHGPIPEGMCVCHSCDVRSCVNPAHLWLGTPADNAHDRDKKGRWRRLHEPDRRGIRNGRAKLTPDQVAEIRSGGDSAKVFAVRFRVAESTIYSARRGATW